MKYQGVQRFNVKHRESFSNGYESTIEVDFNHPNVLTEMEESVLFFMGGKDLISMCDGDVTEAFLKHLGAQIAHIQRVHEYNHNGVVSELKSSEGFPPIDGTCGIKIIECDYYEIEDEDFEVELIEKEDHNG